MITGLTGGILGLVGSLFSKGFTYLDNQHAYKMKVLDFEQEKALLQMQLAENSKDREHEEGMHEDDIEASMYSASIEHDMSVKDTSLWVSNTLRMVRPVITLVLVLLVALVYVTTIELGTKELITASVLELTAMSVSWWFGDRYKSNSKKLPWQ